MKKSCSKTFQSYTIIGTVSETLCYKIISMCICTNERFGVSE